MRIYIDLNIRRELEKFRTKPDQTHQDLIYTALNIERPEPKKDDPRDFRRMKVGEVLEFHHATQEESVELYNSHQSHTFRHKNKNIILEYKNGNLLHTIITRLE